MTDATMLKLYGKSWKLVLYGRETPWGIIAGEWQLWTRSRLSLRSRWAISFSCMSQRFRRRIVECRVVSALFYARLAVDVWHSATDAEFLLRGIATCGALVLAIVTWSSPKDPRCGCVSRCHCCDPDGYP